MEVFLVAYVGSILAMYAVGTVIAVRRTKRDKLTDGQLSSADGQVLAVDDKWALDSPYAYFTERVTLATGNAVRIRISGVDTGNYLGFRLAARTAGGDLAARLVLEGKGVPHLAEALFASPQVKEAVKLVAGSPARFKRVDLYLGGTLTCDIDPLDPDFADDATERLLRLAEVLDATRPNVAQHQLGSASTKSGAPATFSIELR